MRKNVSVHSSIERVIKQLADAQPGWTYIYWDDRDQNSELPPGDLIGPMGIGWEDEGQNCLSISMAVALSTVADPNRFRMKLMVDDILAIFGESKHITLYDYDTKMPAGELYVHMPYDVLPISSAEQRVVQLIQLKLSTTVPTDS